MMYSVKSRYHYADNKNENKDEPCAKSGVGRVGLNSTVACVYVGQLSQVSK